MKEMNLFRPPPLPKKGFIPPPLPQGGQSKNLNTVKKTASVKQRKKLKEFIIAFLLIFSVFVIILILYFFNKRTESYKSEESNYSSISGFLKNGEIGLRDENGNEYGAQIDEDYYFGSSSSNTSSISNSSSNVSTEYNKDMIIGKWYCTRSDFEKKYRPCLILYKDNSFKMVVNLLECMSDVTGTYSLENGIIYCHVKSKNFKYAFAGYELDEYVFKINNETLIYESDVVGGTYPGDVFMRE